MKYILENLLDNAIMKLKDYMKRGIIWDGVGASEFSVPSINKDWDKDVEYLILAIADRCVSSMTTYDLLRYGAENHKTLYIKPQRRCDDDMVEILKTNIHQYLVEGLNLKYSELTDTSYFGDLRFFKI